MAFPTRTAAPFIYLPFTYLSIDKLDGMGLTSCSLQFAQKDGCDGPQHCNLCCAAAWAPLQPDISHHMYIEPRKAGYPSLRVSHPTRRAALRRHQPEVMCTFSCLAANT